MVQPLCAQLNAGAVAHVLLDEVALVVPAIQTVDPDEAVVGGLLLELTLTVDRPADQPAGVTAGDDAAGDDLAGQGISLAYLLDGVKYLLVCGVDSPGFPAGLLDAGKELFGTAESGILRRDLLPHLDGGAFAVLDGDDGGVGLIAVGGGVALAAVGADDEIVFGQVDDLLNAALRELYLLCDFLFGRAVADDVGDSGVVQDLSAVVGDVLAHREDHGFILIVAGEAERAQVGQTVNVVDIALKIELHLKGGVPLLKGKHGLPVGPEVGLVEVLVEHVVNLFILKGLVRCHEQLEQLSCGGGVQTVFSVGAGVLSLLLGDAAEGEVRVFLVQVIVFGENGLAGIDDGGDGLEQIPHALEVVIHLAPAAHDEAFGRVINAVAGAAGEGEMLEKGDLFARHLGVADQEAGRRKTC